MRVNNIVIVTLLCVALHAQSSAQTQTAPASKPPFEYPPCDPPVGDVVFGHDSDGGFSARIKFLFEQDQAREKNAPASREDAKAYWTKVVTEDHDRQVEIMGYLHKGEINSADDLYHAAMIFQHGNCPDHFKLANQLAEKAVALGSKEARWLYAATLDRYLMSQGKPQKFGTQFMKPGGADTWQLYTLDPTTTDEERARYNVPTLAQQQQKLERLNPAKPPEPK